MNFVKKNYPYLTGIFVFVIYLFTLAPSVVEIDSGELATVICTLGIAHPTGYPLFSMIGYLFTLIPLPFSGIIKVNLLAALWCSSAVAVFVLTVKTVLENLPAFAVQKKETPVKGAKKNKRSEAPKKIVLALPDLSEEIKILTAIFSGLILAFNRTFWSQSTSIEVYSLHLLLITLVIFSLIKAFIGGTTDLKFSLKDRWLVFSFFLALSFSNHMTTLFILPGIAYFYFQKHKISSASVKKIGLMLAVFFPVLVLIYSYIPIRASFNPVMNWGNATNMEKLLRHISGKQYQVWLFTSFGSAEKQFSHFIDILLGNYSGSVFDFGEFNVTLIIIIAGVAAAFKYARKFWYFLIITFLFTILYSINYDIVDIDTYFLLAFISLAYFSVFGILWMFRTLKFEKFSYLPSAAIISVLIVIQCFINFKETNVKDVYVFEDYTKEILNSVDTNSIILSYQWDYFVSQAYYFQNVENYRKDVAIIDKEILRRSWYFNQLERNHPGLISRIQPTVDGFLKALVPFERSEDFDSNLLETYYRKILTELVSSNIENKSVYIGTELVENEMKNGSFSLPEGYTLIPDIFLFKVVKQNSPYTPAKINDFTIRIPYRLTKYIDNIEHISGTMLVRRALYELQFNHTAKAKSYTALIKKNFPDYVIPDNLARAIGG